MLRNIIFQILLVIGCSLATLHANDTITEVEKWDYVRNEFKLALNNATGLSNKVGNFLQVMSPVLGVTTASMVMYDVILKDFEAWHHHYISNLFLLRYPTLNAFEAPRNRQLELEGLLKGLLAGIGSHFLCKLLGLILEAKEEVCLSALTSFVRQWEKHKPKTPEVLHALFDELAEEFNKTSKITGKVSALQAPAIVDVILLSR